MRFSPLLSETLFEALSISRGKQTGQRLRQIVGQSSHRPVGRCCCAADSTADRLRGNAALPSCSWEAFCSSRTCSRAMNPPFPLPRRGSSFDVAEFSSPPWEGRRGGLLHGKLRRTCHQIWRQLGQDFSPLFCCPHGQIMVKSAPVPEHTAGTKTNNSRDEGSESRKPVTWLMRG